MRPLARLIQVQVASFAELEEPECGRPEPEGRPVWAAADTKRERLLLALRCAFNRKSFLGITVCLGAALLGEFVVEPHVYPFEHVLWIVGYCLVNLVAAAGILLIFLGMFDCCFGSWSNTPKVFRVFAIVLPLMMGIMGSSPPFFLLAGRPDLMWTPIAAFSIGGILMLLATFPAIKRAIHEERQRTRVRLQGPDGPQR